MPKWTKNQEDAINSTRGSVLVSASAGSGKTAVLVERVINRITDENNPTPADRMLVVTYTKAAAAEMKERIIARLSQLIKENPFDTNLRRQQLRLQNAHISTIHSFCSELVREYFYILNVSKDFRIADDSELDLLKKEAMDETFDELYSQKDNSNFLSLVENFSGNKNDKALQDAVFKLYDFLLSHPFPEDWMAEKLSYYNSENISNDNPWADVLFDYAMSGLDYAFSVCEINEKEVRKDEKLEEKLTPIFISDKMLLNSIISAVNERSWDTVYSIVSSLSFDRMPSIRGYKDNPLKNSLANNRDTYKKLVTDLQTYFFCDEEAFKKQVDLLEPIVREMFHTVIKFKNTFNAKKGERNILDFSDLEHLAIKLLVKKEENGISLTQEAEKIASSFDEVMVDEYQDANEVQDIIFKAVSGNEKNLFVVGDVKQSIYSFRQAMPQIFIKRRDNYPVYNSEKDNYPGRIILEKNFRSRSEVTDTVNFMFRLLMSKDCGEIDYNEDEYLVCGADYNQTDDTKVSLSLIDMDSVDEDDICIAEADYIATEINRIKGERTVYDKGVLRKPQDKDFAILLRSSNKYAQDYVNRLKLWGIQASSSVSDSFLSNREVMIILNLLRVIDNPLRDIPLLSVVMSPLYGFTADELADMRGGDKHRSIYLSLKSYAEGGSTKSQSFLSELQRFRTYSVTMSLGNLINKIYEETAYPSLLRGMYESDAPNSNILLFKEYAENFEKNGLKGLSSFINYMDNVESQGGDLESSKDNSMVDSNTVKVMSIHGSKGLEFPFVFLANTSRKFVTDSTQNVLLHKDLGFSTKLRDFNRKVRVNTVPRQATAVKMANSEKSEELRILYVALTRAREELHMVCAQKGMEKYIKRISTKITRSLYLHPFSVSSAGKISDWLIMCGLVHPDGKALREVAEIENFSTYLPCPRWDIKYISHPVKDIEISEKDETVLSVVTEDTDDSIDEIISTRFNFEYKNKDINTLPVKVSVSDIAHKISKEKFSSVMNRPQFMSE
ncbi:MAG: helicase-exonuclease AddAB subunit AddA, partial [Ruminococcus sp.]